MTRRVNKAIGSFQGNQGKELIKYDEQAQKKKPKEEQAQWQTNFGTNKVVYIIAQIECYTE